MVWRALKGWQVENTNNFVPNVVSFLLMLGTRQWYVAGSYVPPNDVSSMHRVDQALQGGLRG